MYVLHIYTPLCQLIVFCSEDVGQSPGRGRESDLKEMTSQTKWWWLDPAGCLCNSHQLCNSQQHQHQQHDLKDMTSQTKCWCCERQHHQCKCHFKYHCGEIDYIPRILGSKERHYETVHDPFRIDLLVLQKSSKGRINTFLPILV